MTRFPSISSSGATGTSPDKPRQPRTKRESTSLTPRQKRLPSTNRINSIESIGETASTTSILSPRSFNENGNQRRTRVTREQLDETVYNAEYDDSILQVPEPTLLPSQSTLIQTAKEFTGMTQEDDYAWDGCESCAQLTRERDEAQERMEVSLAQYYELNSELDQLRAEIDELRAKDQEATRHLEEQTTHESKEKTTATESLLTDVTMEMVTRRRWTGANVSNRIAQVQTKLQSVTAFVQRRRPVWECAVSLAWLQTFARDVDPILSTYEVVQKIIKPGTIKAKRRYTDKLAVHEYSSPTFFISHRWSDRFRELVETLSAHCQTSGAGDPTQIFLWIDIFAVNQHTGAAQADDLANLDKAIIESKKGTLLAMDPGGGVLKRIWCLFEIHKTVQRIPGKEADLTLLMPKNVDSKVMQEVWESIDVEKAQATVPEDRDRILHEIRESAVDTKSLNHTLKATLISGSTLQLDSTRESYLDTLARGARMLDLAGRYSAARLLIEESISLRERMPNIETSIQQEKLANDHLRLSDVLCDGLSLYQESLICGEKALEIFKQLYSDTDHPKVAEAFDRVGWSFLRLSRFDEAESHIRSGLQMRERLFKGDKDHLVDFSKSLASLSRIHHEQGKLDEALELLDQSSAMTLRLHGPNTPAYATSLGSRALLLLDLGRGEEAVTAVQASFQIRLTIYGHMHPYLSHSHDLLASCLESIEHTDAGLEHREKCLEIRQSSLGVHHFLTGTAERSLAVSLHKCNRAEDALTHVTTAAAILYEADAHEEFGSCLISKFEWLLDLNRPKDALPVAEALVTLHERISEKDSSETADSFQRKARVLDLLGSLEESLTYWNKAADIRAAIGLRDHDTAYTRWNLALALVRLDRYEECLPYVDDAMDIFESIEMEDELALCMKDKIEWLLQLSRPGEAIMLATKLVPLCQRVFGAEHTNTAFAFEWLHDVYQALEQNDDALTALLKCLAIRQVVPEDVELARTQYNLSLLLEKMGRVDVAVLHVEEAARIYLAVGEESNAADALSQKVDVLRAMNRASDTLPVVQDLLALRIRLLGEDHVMTAKAYECISDTLESLERYEESFTHRQKLLDIRLKTAVHIGVSCDGCGMNPLRGARHKCKVCANFNLCEECHRWSKEAKQHRSSHPMNILPPRQNKLTADTEWKLSLILEKLSRFDESIRHCDEAAKIFAVLKNDTGIRKCATQRANLVAQLAQIGKSPATTERRRQKR